MKKEDSKKDQSNFLRLYDTISQINQIIIRAKDQDKLFSDICRAATEQGKFRMAWIGLIDETVGKIKPVVFAGEECGYLSNINIITHDKRLGNGPTGAAFREGQCIICQNILNDPRMLPWRDQAIQRGYRSSAAVPFRKNNHPIGVLTVYASELLGFSEDDRQLLERIGQDISFALDSIDIDIERKKIEKALRKELEMNKAITVLSKALISGEANIQSIAESTLEFARSLTGSSHGFVSYIDPQSGDSKAYTLTSMMKDQCQLTGTNRRFAFSAGRDGRYPKLWGHALNTRQGFFTNNPSSHPASSGTPVGHIPLKNFLAVPSLIKDMLVGEVVLANAQHDYTDEDLNTVSNLSSLYAMMVERTETEKKLREREQQYRLLMQKIQAAVVVHNADTKIISSNPTAHKLLGLSEEQLFGKTNIDPAWHFLREDGSIMPVEEYPINRVLQSKKPLREYVAGIFHPDTNSHVWTLVNADPVFTEQGDIGQVIVTFVDITDRKHIEEALQRAYHYNRSLIEASLDPLVTIDVQGKITDVNSATENVTGYLRQSLIGTEFSDYFTEPDKAKSGYQKVFAAGSVQDYPLVIRHRNGKVTPVLYNASVYTDVSGTVIGVFAAARDITKQKRAEKANAKLAAIIESSDDAIVGKNLDGIIESWNAGAERIYGYRAEDVIGKNISVLAPEDRKSEVKEILQRIINGERVSHVETVRIRKDGTPIAVSLTVSPTKDESGKIIGASSIARDITERKRTEELLKQSESRLMEAQRLAHFGSWELDLKNNHLQWSPEIYAIFEIDQNEFGASYEAFLSAIHPEDRNAVNEAYSTSVRNKTPYTIDHRLLFADGRIKYVHEQCETFYDTEGKPIRSLGTVQDITERKSIEENLRNANIYTRSLIEASLDPLVTISAVGKITDVNAATEAATGLTRRELIGTDFSDYFTKPDKARMGYREVFQKGFVKDYALEIRHRDGHITPVLYNASIYKDTSGVVIGVFAAARDITETKLAEQALKQANEKLEAIFSNTQILFALLDTDFNFIRVNRAYAESDERSTDYFPGKNHFALYPNAENEAIFKSVLKHRKEYTVLAKPFQYPEHPERGIMYWDWTLSPIIGSDGKIDSLLFTLLNVTERKLAEREIQKLNEGLELRVEERTAQLEAANKEMEAFSYSVSHDLRAPLRSIDGFSHILLEDYLDRLDETGKDYLRRVRSAAQYMAQLIDDMLNLSRITRIQPSIQSVNLSDIATAIIDELQQSQPERNIDVVIQENVVARGDARLLKIVLDNLLRNAWKFTSKKSSARIEFAMQMMGDKETFYIRDNGAGFDMTYASKLFGAFQRLHAASEFPGTGIGLATVQRVIHKHGGTVWAEGKLGQGATFYFTIP